MKKYAVIYDGQLTLEFDNVVKAMEHVKGEIHDCYTKGEEYYIFKNVCVGTSEMPVSFSEEGVIE